MPKTFKTKELPTSDDIVDKGAKSLLPHNIKTRSVWLGFSIKEAFHFKRMLILLTIFNYYENRYMHLLSGFFDIIILFGAVQGFIVSLLLFFSKANKLSNCLLAVLILLLTLVSLHVWLLDQQWYQTVAFQMFSAIVPMTIVMPLGPLIYFYNQSLLNPNLSTGKIKHIHFYSTIIDLIPQLVAIIYIIGVISGLLKNNQAPVARFIDNYNVYVDIPRWASLSIYLMLSFRSLFNFKKETLNQTGQLKWLLQLNIAFVVFQFIWLVYLIPYVIPAFTDKVLGLLSWYPIYVPLSILIYWLSIKGYLMQQHQTSVKKTRIFTQSEQVAVDEIVAELKKSMEDDRLYLNPDLTLNLLAEYVGIGPKIVSAVLNQYLDSNFNDFVNRYRVMAFKEKYPLPQYANYTIVGIAFECGFKSQPTFQRAFKQFTGCAPSDFNFHAQ